MPLSQNCNTYDYIIVGVGTAGAVFAKLLSDDKKTRVLGLESGINYDNNPLIKDSSEANSLDMSYHYKFFWQGESEPAPINDQTYHWPGGRLLGGCSSINGEQYVKGTISRFAKWEALLGQEWSVAKIYDAYNKLETYHGISTTTRGTNGPLSILQTPVNPTNMNTKIVNALAATTGYPEILDYNDPATPIGPFTRWQLTQRPDTIRVSSSNAFLDSSVMDPKGHGVCCRKLQVVFGATVNKIIWERDTNGTIKAIGVAYIRNGISECAYASKRIIMCAGVRSPEILMRSGIGPKEVLDAAGVKPVYIQPNLGINLLNHTTSTAVFSVNPDDIPYNNPNEIYTSGAFLPDPSTPSDTTRAFEFLGMYVPPSDTTPASLAMVIIPVNPKSTGTDEIQTPDPYTIPAVNFNYFSNPVDINCVVTMYQTYIKGLNDYFISNPAIYNGYQLISPDPSMLQPGRESDLINYITSGINPTHHITSHCRMAPENQGGVVNAYGEVYGVRNLIVADDSICPFINDGNTQSTAYLVAYIIANQLLRKSVCSCSC